MRILGRDIELSRIPAVAKLLVCGVLRAFKLFERPFFLLRCYLLRRTPLGSTLNFRDGGRIALSSYPGDVVTVFVVFCKEEYGTDFAGKSVLDIGGNIGAFSLLACRHGCRHLVAVEPSVEAHRVLQENMVNNGFSDRVTVLHAAVCGSPRESVTFPSASSPLNTLGGDGACQEMVEVPASTLGALLGEYFGEGLDLLKMDCEGAEIDIVANATLADLEKIREIRMEFHEADVGPTIGRLHEAGFQIVLYERLGPVAHTIWLRRGEL